MAWGTQVPPAPVKAPVAGWFAIFNLLATQPVSINSLGRVVGLIAALQSAPITNAAAVKGMQTANQSLTITNAGASSAARVGAQSFSITDWAILRGHPLANNSLTITELATVVVAGNAAQQISIVDAAVAKGIQSGSQSLSLVNAAINRGIQIASQSFTITDSATWYGKPGAVQPIAMNELGSVVGLVLSPQQLAILNAALVTGFEGSVSGNQFVSIADSATVVGLRQAGQSFTVLNGASVLGSRSFSQVIAITESGAAKGIQAANTSFTITEAGAVYVRVTAAQSMSVTNGATVYEDLPVAPTFDAVSSSFIGFNSSVTASHVATAGAYAIVDVSSGNSNVTGVTYNGAAMDFLGSQGGLVRYGKANVSGGSGNVVASTSASTGISIICRTYLNVADTITTSGHTTAGQVLSKVVSGLTSTQMTVQSFGVWNSSASGAEFIASSGGTHRATIDDGNRSGLVARDHTADVTFSATYDPSYATGWGALNTLLLAVAYPRVYYVGVSNAAGHAAGTTGTAALTVNPTLPTGTVSGDRVFIVAGATNSINALSGWTALASNTAVGTGVLGAGTGARVMSVYYRDYDGVWTMPSVTTASAVTASLWAAAISVRRSSNTFTWDTPTFPAKVDDFGTANTAHSVIFPAGFQTTANALLILGSVFNDNVTSTTATLTQTSATFTGPTERADGGTATGNDVSGKIHTAEVVTGQNGSITFNLTLNAASQGATLLIQQMCS